MKILEKLKSMSIVALAAVFFLSATLISCGDGKKDASSEDEATEEVIMEEEMPMEEKSEHPSDSTHEESEHPSEGGEHPTD